MEVSQTDSCGSEYNSRKRFEQQYLFYINCHVRRHPDIHKLPKVLLGLSLVIHPDTENDPQQDFLLGTWQPN
jgi:hypothetical protein